MRRLQAFDDMKQALSFILQKTKNPALKSLCDNNLEEAEAHPAGFLYRACASTFILEIVRKLRVKMLNLQK